MLAAAAVVVLAATAAGGCAEENGASEVTVSPTTDTPSVEPDQREPPCPVQVDACVLAAEFLPLVKSNNAEEIASRATAQTLDCPATEPGPDDVVALAVASACEGRLAPASIRAFEIHNGKGPLYFPDRSHYADAIAGALESLHGSTGDIFHLVALGCGIPSQASGPDCDRASAAVYASSMSEGPSASMVVLVFSRPSADGVWAVEKLWTPFPGAIPQPIALGFRAEISTGGGVRAVELAPLNTR
jgi:hypothetical protein